MPENVERVRVGGREIVLVGTAHVSRESVKLVAETIEREKPDSVGVELCDNRYRTITDRKKWEDTKITEILKQGKTHLFLANLLLSTYQKRIGEDLEVQPGAEMIEAMSIGKKAGAKIVLVDRDIQVTLKRAWRKMSVFEKFRLVSSLLFGLMSPEEIEEELVEKLKQKDIVTQMMEELGREVPSAKRVLLDERDIYIANKILGAPGKKIVAVVGAGHVAGIKRHLGKKADIRPLEEIPEGSKWLKYVAYLVPLVFLGVVGYGFLHHRSLEFTFSMVLYWFLINGSLSALGAVLALAHPLTVLSAFVAAPFTSLNPTIGAGIVAGLVEAKFREPRVKDFRGLAEISAFGGFYRNRVSRILLVAAFANVGSSVGTFVALPYLMSLL